jgi:hypothetical protein
MNRAIWSDADLQDLRRLVEGRSRGINWGAVVKRFPTRTKASIYKQMSLHGMTRPVMWTSSEDETLRNSWNEVGNRVMAKRLPGRTLCGIYERARALGLRAGTPQGMVSVKSLANDPLWGYDYYKTLRILKAHEVPTHRFGYTNPGKRPRGTLYVDRSDAREAAEAWERAIADQRVGKETPKEAAKRIGVRAHTLSEWLTDAGLLPPRDSGVKRIFWAAPEVYDAIAERYKGRARCAGKECPKHAAKRLGVGYDTLRRWLRDDGVTKVNGSREAFWATPDVYDRVCARHRQPPEADRIPRANRSIRIEGADPATSTPPPA